VALNVRGSDSLYWRAGIDTDNLRRDATTVKTIMATVTTFLTGYLARDVMKAAQEQDRALTKVAATYKQLGIYTGDLMRDTIKLGDEMQRLANVEDEVVQANIAVMATIGKLTADQIEPATKAAIGLSKAYGLELSSAFNLVGKAAAGHTEMLARYGIVLAENLSNEEKFNEILKRGAEAFEQAKAQASDATGQWEKMTLAVGDAKEAVGGFATNPIFLWVLKTWTDGVKTLTDYLNNLGTVWDLLGNKIQRTWVNVSYYMKAGGLYATPGVKNMAELQQKLLEEKEQSLRQLEKYILNKINENERKATSKWDTVLPGGIMPGGVTPKAFTEEQKKQYDEILAATQTAEERVTAIHKTAAELIMTTDNKVEQNKIRIWEAQQAREARGLGNPFTMFGNKASFVQYEQSAKDFSQKLADDMKVIDEKMGENSVEVHRESLDEILKDTRGFTSKELIAYAKVLQQKADLYKDDKEMRLKLLDEATKAIQESYDLEIKKIREIGDAFSALGGFIGQFDSKLGGAISGLSGIASSVNQIKNATTLWGQISGGVGAATGVMGIFDVIAKKFIFNNKEIENSLKQIARAVGEFDLVMNIVNENLDESTGTRKLAAIYDGYNKISKSIKDLKQELKKEPFSDELRQRLYEAQLKQKELARQADEILTGTTVEAIADSITEGFARGLTAAEVFAENFQSIMRKAIIDTFKAKIITDQLEAFYNDFAIQAYGGLTAEEIKYLAGNLNDKLANIETTWTDFENVMTAAGYSLIDKTNAKATGLAGEISGVSEQTAGLLAGQMQNMMLNVVTIRDNLSSVLAYNSNMNNNLSVIMSTALDNLKANQETAVNTRYLKEIKTLLQSGNNRAIGV
jgi:tetratricopeptide (TPR) repeat protein